MNQDIANIIHSSGTMTKKESILKVLFYNHNTDTYKKYNIDVHILNKKKSPAF